MLSSDHAEQGCPAGSILYNIFDSSLFFKNQPRATSNSNAHHCSLALPPTHSCDATQGWELQKTVINRLFTLLLYTHQSLLESTWKFTINKNVQLDDFPFAKEWFHCPLEARVLKIQKGKLLGIVDTYFCCKTGLVPWAKYKASFVNLTKFFKKVRHHGGGNKLNHNFQTMFPYCHSEKLPGVSRVVYKEIY